MVQDGSSKNGNAQGNTKTVGNIPQKKRYEEERKTFMQESKAEKQKLVNVFELAPAMIAILHGPTYIYEFANSFYLKVVGKTKDILGKSVKEVFPELKGQGILELLDNIYRTAEPFVGNELLIKLDIDNDGLSEDVYFNFVYQPTRDESGDVDGILVHAVDVTSQVVARRNAEQLALQVEQQARTFDATLKALKDFVYTFDISGRFTYANNALLGLLGITLGEIVGKNFHDLPYSEELATLLQAQIELVVTTGKPVTDETPYVSPAGVKGYYEYIFTPVFDNNKNVVLVAGSTRDISERKQAEEQQHALSQQTIDVLESMGDAFFMLDKDWNIVRVNHIYEHISQVKRADSLGKYFWNLFPAATDPSSNYWIEYHKVMATKQPSHFVEYYGPLELWTEVGVYPTREGGISAFFRDITRQKRAEQALRESEERFRSLADQAPMAVFMADGASDVTYWNKYWLEFIGGTLEEALGTSWQKVCHPDDFEHLLHVYLSAVTARQSYSIEARFKRWDGEYRTFLFTGGPRYSTDGDFAGYVGMGVDITRQKELERQKDDFMGIVSHELKTPVTSIKAFTQVLQRRFAQAGDEKSAVLLGKMDAQINKLTGLIGDLLDVTKIEAGKLQFNEVLFSFDELVDEVVEEVQRATKKHTIEKVGKTEKWVCGDKDRTGQVIINLLTNAIKYSPSADKVIIRSSAEHEHVTLCVQDFGVGIPQEKQQQIFERFYRVDENETISGIGLGLYISAEIIKRQNGTIWVESTQGEGSTFCFRIPVEQQKTRQ